MEKKIYVRPDLKIMVVEPQTILAASTTGLEGKFDDENEKEIGYGGDADQQPTGDDQPMNYEVW